MKSYKAAIVGCGQRAHDHVEAYRHLPNVRVVACSAPSPTRREPFAQKYGLKAYADTAEMIRRERPDIVHLITWPKTRVELMTLVSDLDVPLCTVEKPVAIGVDDWRALQRLESESKTKFAVCHQLRWHPNLRKCQESIARGEIGVPLFLDISSGMNIAGQGTHTLNYGRSLVGDSRVKRVFGQASGWDDRDEGHPAPDSTEAFLDFENGVRGLWTSGPVSPRCGDPKTTWQHVRVAVHSDRGRALFEEFGKWEIVGAKGITTGTFGGMDEWKTNNLLAQAGFHQAMFDWAEKDHLIPGTSLAESLHEWAVVLALYTSVLERRPIDLNDFNPSPPSRLREALKIKPPGI